MVKLLELEDSSENEADEMVKVEEMLGFKVDNLDKDSPEGLEDADFSVSVFDRIVIVGE